MILFLLFVCLVPQALWAKYVAILETMAEPAAKTVISAEELRYLTDVLRGQAIQSLPAEQNFTIMTRENINVMLPPGKSIEDCEGSCLAETGKNIAADYVSQGRITMVGSSLAISVEMYETAGNKLISSFNGKGANAAELEQVIKTQSEEFFKKIKNAGTGWGEFSADAAFAFQATQKVIVELNSEPVGAVPSVDGKAVPKCTSTPCKVLLEAGQHRFVMSKEHYDDTELTVDIVSNNQQVNIELAPIYGFLNVTTKLIAGVGSPEDVNVTVDGESEKKVKDILLDQGPHKVVVSHPCYDPSFFNVAIEKLKTTTIEKEFVRGIGGLELSAERNNEPFVTNVYVDGAFIGKTPFSGTVPLCSKITVGDSTYTEEVNANLKWHEVAKVAHSMGEPPPPPVVFSEPDSSMAPSQKEFLPKDLSGKEVDEHSYRWSWIAASGVITAAGVATAIVGNYKAKKASEKGFESTREYEDNMDEAEFGQKVRTTGIAIAILGAVCVGVSFAF